MNKWLPETAASRESSNRKPSREIIEKSYKDCKSIIKKPTLTDIAHAAQVRVLKCNLSHIYKFSKGLRSHVCLLDLLPGEEQEGVRYFLKLDNHE